jgi:Tol biopolymer transport system component
MITRRQVFRAVLLLVILALAGNVARQRLQRPSAAVRPVPVRTIASIPPERALDSFAVSPDGNTLAYAAEAPDGRLHLFLHQVDAARDGEVGESTGAHDPFFSPDGTSVAFFSRDALWRVSETGGTARRVCAAPGDAAGGSWTDDGRIVFAPLEGQGLSQVSSAGGSPAPVTTLSAKDGELAHGWPHALPGGAILFTVSQRGRDPHLEVLSPDGKRGPRLVPAIGQAAFVSSGQIVYSYLGDLYAVPFDLSTSRTTGVPVMFAKGVQTASGFDQLGRSAFAVSRGGTLAWVRASATGAGSDLVKVDGTGVASSLRAASAAYQTPRLSPDGRQLAVVVTSGLMTREIRVLDMAHPDRIVATIRGGDNQSPAWTPDGRLSFASNREGLQKIYLAAGRDFSRITPLFSMDVQSPRNPSSWVKAPPLLAFYEIDPFRGRDVMIYRVGEAIFPVAATTANERSPVLSPDGQSVAWVSDASGRDEVYMKKLDDQGEGRALTTTGGEEPVWSRQGLLYREGDRMVRDGTTLFEGRFEKDPGANAADYDVDRLGRFFVMLKSAGHPKEIRVIKNWAP